MTGAPDLIEYDAYCPVCTITGPMGAPGFPMCPESNCGESAWRCPTCDTRARETGVELVCDMCDLVWDHRGENGTPIKKVNP